MLLSFLFRKKTMTTADHSAASSDPSLGVKTIAADANVSTLKSNCVVERPLVVASAPSSVELDSVAEEVADEEDEDEEEEEEGACWATYGSRRGRWQWRRFPPPIPLLARTGNLTGHMPWVLQRIYCEDGRLEIREVRVKHHEYFRHRRRHGRLVLQSIVLNDNGSDDDDRPSDEEKEEAEKCDLPSVLPPSCPQNEKKAAPSPWLVEVAVSTSAAAAAAMMSASLPEVMCGKERFDVEPGSRSLHRRLPVSRMRMVHG